MRRTNINPKANQEEKKFAEHIFENALGVPISLESAPTTSGGELKANEVGFYSGSLYINFNGVTYQLNMTEV